MKTVIFILITGCLLPGALGQTRPIQSADSYRDVPHLAYLTSWGLVPNSAKILRASKMDGYILAFARWNESGEVGASNQFFTPPADPCTAPSLSYQTWTRLAHRQQDKTILVSFGGQEYEDIWSQDVFLHRPDYLARQIADLLAQKFPIYKAGGNEDPTAYVELDGIDLDFEQSSRLTPEQNDSLIALVKALRLLVGNTKIISLTTYHVGADPAACRNAYHTQDCSYRQQPRSSHHGEVIAVLTGVKGLIDWVNVMAYDADRQFDYRAAMQNYARLVGSYSRLKLGLTINRQWSADGGFVMSHDELQRRARWASESGVSGLFVWALGANTEGLLLPEQVDRLNNLVSEFTKTN